MALGGALDPAVEGARGGSLQLRRRFSSTPRAEQRRRLRRLLTLKVQPSTQRKARHWKVQTSGAGSARGVFRRVLGVW